MQNIHTHISIYIMVTSTLEKKISGLSQVFPYPNFIIMAKRGKMCKGTDHVDSFFTLVENRKYFI